MVPPEDIEALTSAAVNVTLFGSRVFADDQVMMTSLVWAPNLIRLVLLQKEKIWTQGQIHVVRTPGNGKVEIVVMHLQAREHHILPVKHQGLGERPGTGLLHLLSPSGLQSCETAHSVLQPCRV